MDWYPWYFTLYEQDTMHLNPYQDGCYRRLIDHYMKTRAALPDSDAALARIIGDSEANWVAMASLMVRPFFQAKNSRLFLKRCEEVLEYQDKKTTKQSESGKKGAEKRWSKVKHLDSYPIATPLGSAIAQDRTSTRQDISKEEESHADLKQALEMFNQMAGKNGLAIVQKFTQTRKTKLALRLKDCDGLEGWKTALEKISASAFCQGKNDRGWKVDFDFLISEGSFVKLMEGKYDNTEGKQNGKQKLANETAGLLERIRSGENR